MKYSQKCFAAKLLQVKFCTEIAKWFVIDCHNQTKRTEKVAVMGSSSIGLTSEEEQKTE